jgi:hypothetical protein
MHYVVTVDLRADLDVVRKRKIFVPAGNGIMVFQPVSVTLLTELLQLIHNISKI